MTPRTSFASKRRPLSAIFLGADPVLSPSNLPDLPEPPSPSASSTHSGLPSPPATNSTGSGSAGDSREILDRPSHPLTSSAMTMRSEKPLNSRSSRASSPAGGIESRKGEDDEEEDNTARINLSRRRGTSQSSEHVMTLQRVMSLTQRNRMALNKLSSMRLNTPSPPQSSYSSRSPNPPISTSALASTSTRSRSVEPTLSGSETEREPGAHHSNSSDDQSVTPPSSVSHAYAALEGRLRRTSLPVSPSKGKVASSTRSFSPGPTQRTPKKRVSIMSMPDPEAHELDPHDVTSAALAAVASLRRSPGSSGKKNRQPLPREFLEPRRTSSDGRTSKEPTTPQKLPRERYSSLASDTSPSRSSVRRPIQNPNFSLCSSQANQVPTMRKHQTRWMSEDLRTTSARSIVDDSEDHDLRGSNNDAEIRQSIRGGSMEASRFGSLRGAGLSVKTGTDVFREPEELSTISRRPTPIRTVSIQEQESSSREAGPSRATMLHDPRTPPLERGAYSGPRSRPSTSMADFLPFNEDLPPPKTAPPGIRTYRSAYALDRDREGIGSRQGSSTPFSATIPQERTYGSPRTRPREFPAQPLDEHAVEHLRLMDESLTMFEGVLSRLPPMGDTTAATVPEVFRNAQALVRFSEQVNEMLRAATNRALERLVDSEVSDASAADGVDLVGLWKDVGGDSRDMLRVSDELVRTTTGFLLGLGKVLRESATAGAAGNGNLQHLRGASEDLSRRVGTDARSSTSAGTGSGKGGSGSGRRSTESRRSWDPARVERDRSDLLRRASSRIDVAAQRASSSMLLREREPPPRAAVDLEGPSARPMTSSTRRLYNTSRESTSTPASAKPELVTIESQKSLRIEEVDDYDPSPTPAPRPRQSLDEFVRKLPQLSTTTPAPLPTLPSESQTATTRRKISAASSNVTMRANPGLNITTPSAAPTTAVTTLPVSRTDSGGQLSSSGAGTSASRSNNNNNNNTVTFSRPLTVSVSTLSGLHRHRPSSSEAPPPLSASSSTSSSSPWTPGTRSGSETERPPPTQSRFSLGLGRRTLGSKSQLSLDAPAQLQPAQATTATAAARGGVQTLARASTTRERRRTITEIFSS